MRAADIIEGDSGAPPEAGAAPPPMRAAGDPPRTPRSTWPLAALTIWPLAVLGAVLIHAGWAGVAYEYLQTDDDSPDLGTSAIDVSLETEAPIRDPADLPPGPDSVHLDPSQEVMEQKTEAEQTELPKATPTETDDPDRVVAPEETKKPQDETPRTPTVQAPPQEAQPASEPTAMPSPENAKEGPRATAPDVGIGESLRLQSATWQKELGVHLKKHLRYPENRPPQDVVVTLRVVFDRTGHVVSAEIAKSSGDAVFDDAALAMLRRADPVPAPPPVVADHGLSFAMPVLFNNTDDKNDRKRRR
jgi:periplasmic protein TonB